MSEVSKTHRGKASNSFFQMVYCQAFTLKKSIQFLAITSEKGGETYKKTISYCHHPVCGGDSVRMLYGNTIASFFTPDGSAFCKRIDPT